MLTDCQLKIAICDDEPNDLEQIMNMTEEILQKENVSHSITEYESSKELLADIQAGKQFQMLLLDVMMDDMSGMELAALLRQQQNNTAIIFISFNREMAMQGYEVSAMRYLAKPLNADKLKEALLHFCHIWQEKKEILLPTAKGGHRISISDIQYVEAYERGTKFILANETIETRLKLCDACELLPKQTFMQCHRSYIVNFSYIKNIRPYEFELKTGITVSIGKTRYSEVNKQFLSYITA